MTGRGMKEEPAILTLEEANAIEWRDLDVSKLDAQSVWDAIESMQEARVISQETLSGEISV